MSGNVIKAAADSNIGGVYGLTLTVGVQTIEMWSGEDSIQRLKEQPVTQTTTGE